MDGKEKIYCHDCDSFLEVNFPARNGMPCPVCGSDKTEADQFVVDIKNYIQDDFDGAA